MTWETSERKHATHFWREKHLTVLSLGCTCFSASFSWRPRCVMRRNTHNECTTWDSVAFRVCFLVFLLSFLTLLVRYVVKIKWIRKISENRAWKQNIKQPITINKETIVIENAISLSVPFAPVIWAADAKSARFSKVATKNPPVSIKCLPHALDCQVKEGDWN